jgi:hypothetical protein
VRLLQIIFSPVSSDIGMAGAKRRHVLFLFNLTYSYYHPRLLLSVLLAISVRSPYLRTKVMTDGCLLANSRVNIPAGLRRVIPSLLQSPTLELTVVVAP